MSVNLWAMVPRGNTREKIGKLAAGLVVSAGLVGLLFALPTGGRLGAVRMSVSPPDAPAWCLDVISEDPGPSAEGSLFTIKVTVTGYSSTPDQTDSTPYITASNTRVRRGILALSRDLLREYTPGAPFGYGDIVELEGRGRFRVEDTMSRRFRKRADIWFESRGAARQWGKQRLQMHQVTRGPGQDAITADAGDILPLFEAALSD